MEITSRRALGLMYSLLIRKALGRVGPFWFENALGCVKYSQQELWSLYSVNENTSVEGPSAAQFNICLITQPDKCGEAFSFQSVLEGRERIKQI